MCAPTSPDYVPALPNNFQVLPPSPEFGFDFVNAFISNDEEEEEPLLANVVAPSPEYSVSDWVEPRPEEDDEYDITYDIAPLSSPPNSETSPETDYAHNRLI